MELHEKDVLHLFAGGGGMPCGMEEAGWRALAAVEVDAIRCQTLRWNFPRMQVIAQPIQQVTLADYPRRYIPVHTYTFPCTNYTQAANVHGHWHGDSLYLEALREAVLMYPEIILVENVVGMRKFPRVMETWRNLPHYYTTEFTLYGEDYSLQRKTRVFLILHRQPYDFPALERYQRPLLGRQLKAYLDSDRQPPAIPSYVYHRLQGAYRDAPIVYDPEQTEPVNLFTNYKRDRSNFLVKDPRCPQGVRPFSVTEVARLHGFPETYRFCGSLGAQYGQIIDAVMPLMAEVLGRALNDYFATISDLAPQPRHHGYRMVTIPRPTSTPPTSNRMRTKQNASCTSQKKNTHREVEQLHLWAS